MTNHQPDPATRKHPNRPFAIATLILVLLFLAGLAGMAVWMTWEMGEFNPQAIFSRITGKEVAFQLTGVPGTEFEQVVIQETKTPTQAGLAEETAASVSMDDQPTAKPTPEVIQATRTPIPTPTLPVTAATTETSLETSESPTDQSTASSSGLTTETASETSSGSTQTATTSELPDTGFMDEVGLPMLALLGAILFFAILLVKYLRTSL